MSTEVSETSTKREYKLVTIKSVEHVSSTPSGFHRFKLTLTEPLEGGDSQINMIIPDKVEYTPDEGQEIRITPGTFGKWNPDIDYLVEKGYMSAEQQEKATAEDPSTVDIKDSETKHGRVYDNNSYWQNKTHYDQTYRDPKIEWQKYLKMVLSTYNTALPLLPPLKTLDQVNAFIDKAIEKANEIYDSRNSED